MVRMNADGTPGSPARAAGRARRAADSVVSPAARMHIARCTPAARARPTTSARSRGKYLVGEMAMAVDHAGRLPATTGPACRRDLLVEADQRRLAAVGLAASTMPFDSMPISFAGLRLKTITIVRPTSASGS